MALEVVVLWRLKHTLTFLEMVRRTAHSIEQHVLAIAQPLFPV